MGDKWTSKRDCLLTALRSSPKGQLKYCKSIDSTTPERLVKELQNFSVTEKLFICHIPVPAPVDTNNAEQEPSLHVEYGRGEDEDVDFGISSTFWDVFYARLLLEEFEKKRQLEVLAKTRYAVQDHEQNLQNLMQTQNEQLNLERRFKQEKEEAFRQALKVESLKALKSQKEREERSQLEFDALVERIQKQRLEEGARRAEEDRRAEQAKRAEEESRRAEKARLEEEARRAEEKVRRAEEEARRAEEQARRLEEEAKRKKEQESAQVLRNKPESVAQAEAPVKKAGGPPTQPTALPDDLKQYIDLQEFLQRYIDSTSPIAQDPANKDLRNKCKLFVTTTLNTLSAVDAYDLRDKYGKLRRLISGMMVQHMDKSFSAGKHPVGVQYCKAVLAHKFVELGEKVVSSNPDSAFVYASLMIPLMLEFEDFRDLVIAYFYKLCPYLVPYCPVQHQGQSIEDYYRSLGYTYTNGKVEEQNRFLKRMEGIARLYFALAVSYIPKEVRRQNPQAQHPMPQRVVYKWFSSLLQLKPVLDVTATLLNVAIEVSGASLMQTSPKDMETILIYIAQKYMQRIREVTAQGHGGPVERLDVLLSKIMSSGSIAKQKKIIALDFW